MRLGRLDLKRYGRFTEHSLPFPRPAPGAPDLHIIYGRNEAGKSTAFAAWLDLLYGIETRSPYAYLHGYENMQIGAVLERDGQEVVVRRIKRLKNSLLDGAGSVLPETVIDGLTGGIDRDGYRAMFSLDNMTLREGGEGILKSEGNLGEMLFSASAGLAGLTDLLAGLRKTADDFHSPGKRATGLARAKAKIAELTEQRRQIDVDAARYRALRDAVTVAEAKHAETSGEHARAAARLEAVRRSLAALPHLARLIGAEAALAELPDLPQPPAGWTEELAGIETGETQVKALLGAAADQADALGRVRDAAEPEPMALEIAAAVRAAGDLRSAHDEAVKDLPKRREEADGLTRQLAEAARALGHPDRPAADLRLPADRLAALRGVLAGRRVAEAARDTARHEADSAEAALGDARAHLPDRIDEEADIAALALLLDRLRTRDPGQALRMATEAAGRTQDALARRMAALRPFLGDLAALDAQKPPTAAALADLSARIATAETDLRTTEAEARRCSVSLAQHQIALAARTVTSGDAVAAAARALREATWAAHRRSLTDDTAEAFETAMRRDDLAMADLAGRLADAALRREKDAALIVAQDEAASAELALQAARVEQAAALAELDAIRRALSPDLPARMDLVALRDWLALRAEALEVAADHRRAGAALAMAAADHAEARAALAGLLGAAAGSGLAYDALLVLAETRVRTAADTAALRKAAADAHRERDRRGTLLTEATDEANRLQHTWTDLCLGTWIDPGMPPAAASAVLDRLAELDTPVMLQDDLAHRIAAMEANRAAFAAAVAPLAARAGIDPVDPARAWDQLHQRVDAAMKDLDDRQRAEGALADLAHNVRDLTAKMQRIAARRAELADFFGADDPARLGALLEAALARSDHLRNAANALRDLTEALALPPAEARATAEAQDRAELDRDRAELEGLAANLFTTVQVSFSELQEARRALEAVGTDDAVARLDAERQAREDDLRDRAETHLRLRFGLVVLDHALRSYRETHRSTMLARASAAFADITDGAYAGLSVQPGKSGDDLVAIPPGGGSKEAQHLSEGTRMQLYLALRIAGYHEFAASRPTVPFIADDIMESFDDARAARSFARLGEMATAGQVIYLTHHEHLRDIARTACPEAQLHRLD